MMNRNTKKLLKDIEKKIVSWNERSMFSLKKVDGLSKSDLDVLELYAMNYNGAEFQGLSAPRGKIKEVLDIYGLTIVKESMYWAV